MKLNNIQVLRGISALLVCFFHFKNLLNFSNLRLGDILFSKGSIGVPIFFIISGFIMAYTTKKENFNSDIFVIVKTFLLKRILRIVPLYYTLSFAWIILGGGIYYFSGVGFSRLWHSLFFIPQKDIFPILYVGWSLNFEIFFYLIFAISLFLKKWRYYFIIIVFIILLIIGYFSSTDNAILKMIYSPTNIYFVIGVVFGLYYHKLNFQKHYTILFIITSLSTFTLYFFDFITPNSLTMYIIIATFVLSFILLDYNLKFKPAKFLIYLGDISFSIYLVHPFIEILSRHFKFDNHLLYLKFILSIILVIIVASITYQLIEKKIGRYLQSRFIDKQLVK